MRPYKHGLEYFPLDVDADEDSSIQYLEAEHGLVAFAVYVRLLMRVYRKGYCIKWDGREAVLFARKVHHPVEDVNAIVEDCINEGLFDRDKYRDHGILTSRAIQERYVEITKRRSSTGIIADHNLLTTEFLSTETPTDGCNNPTKQSKAKESKEKGKQRESKGNGGALSFTDVWNAYPHHVYQGRAAAAFADFDGDPAQLLAACRAVPRDHKQSLGFFISDGTWRDHIPKQPRVRVQCQNPDCVNGMVVTEAGAVRCPDCNGGTV